MTNYRICIQETGQDSFVKPTEAQGYLLAAKGMLEGATPLGSITPTPSLALTLLCGHACEAALKAILAKSGISAQKLSKAPYGHHILNLWEAAKTITTLQAPQPDWSLNYQGFMNIRFIYDTPLAYMESLFLISEACLMEQLRCVYQPSLS